MNMKGVVFKQYVLWKMAKVLKGLSEKGYKCKKEKEKNMYFQQMTAVANFATEILGDEYFSDISYIYSHYLDCLDEGEGGDF